MDRPVVIMSALPGELDLLQGQLANGETTTIRDRDFRTGTIRSHRVVLTAAGIGKVNAAMVTTLAIDHFDPQVLIVTGVAGGVGAGLEPVPPENAEAMARVAAAVEVPICTGERLFTRHGFREIIENTVSHSGKVLIPSYVLSRTQNVLYLLDRLIRNHAFSRSFPVYVDSVYANRMTRIYRKNTSLFSPEARAEMAGENPALTFPGLKETKPRGRISGPAVIIAPSGMANVGSIRQHMKDYLP